MTITSLSHTPQRSIVDTASRTIDAIVASSL